ncbi:hypothetical protein H8959_002575 [Pygathrix nigripes]
MVPVMKFLEGSSSDEDGGAWVNLANEELCALSPQGHGIVNTQSVPPALQCEFPVRWAPHPSPPSGGSCLTLSSCQSSVHSLSLHRAPHREDSGPVLRGHGPAEGKRSSVSKLYRPTESNRCLSSPPPRTLRGSRTAASPRWAVPVHVPCHGAGESAHHPGHSQLYNLIALQITCFKDVEIPDFFCDPSQFLHLACCDTFTNNIVMYFPAAVFGFLPTLGILLSYYKIVFSILRVSSSGGNYKAFSTCGSHPSVVCLFYGTGIGGYLNSDVSSSPRKGAVASVVYTVVTPMLNLFIYSLRNRDIKSVLWRPQGRTV